MDSFIKDNSQTFFTKLEQELNNLKTNKSTLQQRFNNDNHAMSSEFRQSIDGARSTFAKTVRAYTDYVKSCLVNDASYQNLPSTYNHDIHLSSSDLAVDKIFEQAKNRVYLPYLTIGTTVEKVGNESFIVPKMVPWQSEQENQYGNFYVEYDADMRQEAADLVDSWLVRILMAFPAGKVQFSFLDSQRTACAGLWTELLKRTPSIYHRMVFESREDISKQVEFLDSFSKNMTPRLSKLKRLNTIAAVNREANSIVEPYQIVVLYNPLAIKDHSVTEKLTNLIANGNAKGIYFVVMQERLEENEKYGIEKDFYRALTSNKFYQIEQKRECLFGLDNEEFYSIRNTYQRAEALFNLASNQNKLFTPYFERFVSVFQDNIDKDKLNVNDYVKVKDIDDNTWSDKGTAYAVPIGDANGQPFHYVLNEEDHVHTFVLGQTGSGKTVLLNDIIVSSMTKYSPQSLEMYLFDLKQGGVSFAHFAKREVSHARAIFLAKGDREAVAEIFEDIKRRSDARAAAFRDVEVDKLSDYNRKVTEDKKLPTIVIVIDECQEIFLSNGRLDSYQKRILDVVKEIGHQGRSVGVHLIMATQTMKDANLPDDVMSQTTDKFVLKCDSSDLARIGLGDRLKESDIASLVQAGRAIYVPRTGAPVQVQPFYINSEETEKRVKAIYETKFAHLSASEKAKFKTTVYRDNNQGKPFNLLERDGKSISHAELGISIGVGKEPITSKIDVRENNRNVAIFGDQGETLEAETNVTRIVLSMIVSQIKKSREGIIKKPIQIYVINSLFIDEDTGESTNRAMIDALDTIPEVRVLSDKDSRDKVLKDLYHKAMGESPVEKETFLYILRQQSYYDLVNNDLLNIASEEIAADNKLMGNSETNFIFGNDFAAASAYRKDQKTYSQLLLDIAKNGPSRGIHMVVHIDKPGDLLGDNEMNGNTALKLFNEYVICSLSEMAYVPLSKFINSNVIPGTSHLSTEKETVRVIYYSKSTGNKPRTFVPYYLPNINDLINKFK